MHKTLEGLLPISHAEHALGCLLCAPTMRFLFHDRLADILDPDTYCPGPTRRVAESLRDQIRVFEDTRAVGEPSAAQLVEKMDEEAFEVARRLSMHVDRITELRYDRIREHLVWCVKMHRMDKNLAANTENVVQLLEGRRRAGKAAKEASRG